jgi:tetratricopeptide (TPR) repeat protein
MGQLTDVNYVEVRPSIEATIGIARRVYHENTLFGIGANRFADAWRLHKDPTINETIFWDTDFVAGSGFVPTVFVNLGLLGGVLLVVFHLGLLYAGYRILLRTTKRDPYWYYVGTIAFAAALFLWGVSYVYVPGAGILLIASFFTGLTFVAMASLLPDSVKTVPLVVNRQRGFLQMAVVLLVLVASVSGTYSVGKQYLAESQFNKARATSTSVEDLEKTALASYELYPDERFLSAQAQIHLATLSSLLGVAEPTEEQLKAFGHAAKLAVTAAEAAVSRDFTDPDHHAVLAGVFTNLTAAGVEAARSRATESLAEAERLDPLNPGYALLKAQIAARSGNVEAARAAIAEALAMKRNFTQAMYLSAQLDISEGKTESAIETTRSIITLEPNNPTRYFQLGVLLSATNNVAESVAAYRAAIALDPQYANARYLLALAQLSTGEAEAALAQLRTVRETNQGNQALEDLIKQVESGQYQVPETTAFEVPVSERTPAEQGSDVVGEDDVESGLVTPVNTIPESAEVAEPPAVTEFESVEQNGLPAPTSSSEVLPPTP